jgi:hypothetical protein
VNDQETEEISPMLQKVGASSQMGGKRKKKKSRITVQTAINVSRLSSTTFIIIFIESTSFRNLEWSLFSASCIKVMYLSTLILNFRPSVKTSWAVMAPVLSHPSCTSPVEGYYNTVDTSPKK